MSFETSITDDLLVQVLSFIKDDQLRYLGQVCKRWAALLRSRLELWHTLHLRLSPKLSKGRDRRNSYTTPCTFDLARLSSWLARRAGHVRQLFLRLDYPDALLALPGLLGQLAPGLHTLELSGQASRDWAPLQALDWGWLRSMKCLEQLCFEDVLLDLVPLRLPTSLTALHIDRVGAEELGGWDELPRGLPRLRQLQRLTLGTANAFITYDGADDAEEVFAPLSRLRTLEALSLPLSPLASVPSVIAQLPCLTFLGLAGCNPERSGISWCKGAFAPLASATALRHLDLSDCGLRDIPAPLCTLPCLRTLLLGVNCLSVALAKGAAAQGLCLPKQLAHLELQQNPSLPLPTGAAFQHCTALTWLDLMGSCVGDDASKDSWAQLLATLPPGCSCRSSHLALPTPAHLQCQLGHDPEEKEFQPSCLFSLAEAAAAAAASRGP